MEYYFIATDENGNTSLRPSNNFFIRMIQPSITYQLPFTKGNGAGDYQIFSFPYNLSPSNSVASVFPNVATKDISAFRMLRYNSSKKTNDEYAKDEITSVDNGKGYWLLTNAPISATVTNATAPIADHKNLITLELLPGWNQIGNPYPVPVKWSDVQSFQGQPAGVDTLSFYVFKNGWAKVKASEKLQAFSGGFVKNPTSSNITITVPFQGQSAVGGRNSVPDPTSDISQDYWEVDLNIFQGEVQNRIGGIGMATNAFYGYDRYDDSNPPGFSGMPELSFHQKETQVSDMARSVVPTQKEYTWSFNVTGEIGQPSQLTWNEDLGQGNEQLFLLDEQSMQLIDMRSQQIYSFQLKEHQSFKIFFGSNVRIATEEIQLSSPFPNPLIDRKTNFNIGLPDSQAAYQVSFQVFSSSGIMVHSNSINLESGIRQWQWQADENSAPGLYIYRVAASDGNKNFVTTGKIIIP
jgi:hypothetical protein